MADLCPKRSWARGPLITASPSQPAETWQIISEGQHAVAEPPASGPALLIDVVTRGPGDSVGSSAVAANNGLIDAGAQRLGARVPRPFPAWPPRTTGGPFP